MCGYSQSCTGDGLSLFTSGGDYAIRGDNTSTSSGVGVAGDGWAGVYGTGDYYGVFGYVTGPGDRGVYGQNTSASFGYGVYGDGETGVYGTGDLYGVRGRVEGSAATAVIGENWNTDGGNGVYGHGYIGVHGFGGEFGVFGDGYIGVRGGGDLYGVRGVVTAGDATAVYGENTNTNGGNGVWGEGYYGVYGTGDAYGVYGDGFTGVYGTGDLFGVHGEGFYGVWGAGDNYGVVGNASGASASGVYGYNTDTESGYGVYGDGYWGVYGTGDQYGVYGDSWTGVYGTGGMYGVHGYVNDFWAVGVYGKNTDTNAGVGVYGDGWTGVYGSGDNYGVYGAVTGSTATAVYGTNTNTSGGNGVWGWGYDGVYGEGIRSGLFGRSDQYGVLGAGPVAGGRFDDSDSGTYTLVASGDYGIYTNGDIYSPYTTRSVQPHPTDANKSIIYASLEGGEAGTYYRGTAQLEKGAARVELPQHFSLVTEEEGLTVQVTPRGDCNGLYVAEVTTTYVVVEELQGGSSNARFDFFINGVRTGYADYQVVVDTEELGLDAMEHPPEPPPPPAEPQPPERPRGTGTEGGGPDE